MGATLTFLPVRSNSRPHHPAGLAVAGPRGTQGLRDIDVGSRAAVPDP